MLQSVKLHIISPKIQVILITVTYRSSKSILKKINPEYSLEGLMLKLKLQYFGHLIVKNWITGNDPDAGKDCGWEEKGTTEDEMVGWHHQLSGHGFGWTLGVGDGQGGLACCGPWGRKELDTTERLNWTEDLVIWPRTLTSKADECKLTRDGFCLFYSVVCSPFPPYKLTVKNKNKTTRRVRMERSEPSASSFTDFVSFCCFGFPQNVFLDELKGRWWKSTALSGELPRAVPGGVSSQDKQILTGPYTSFLGFSGGSGSKESASNAGDLGSIPQLGRSLGEDNGYPFQHSCLENPMDRGAWWATGLQFMGLQRVGHDGATSECTCTHTQILSTYLYLWAISKSPKTGY